MRIKCIYKYKVFAITVILALSFGCSSAKIQNGNTAENNTSINTTAVESVHTTNSDNKKGADSIKVIEDFIKSIRNNDAEALKYIISSSGLIIIRNFSSGGGMRGKDIRNIYSVDKIPSNLQFEISGEVPVVFHEFFENSQRIEIKDIPVETIENISFSFIDSIGNNIIGPFSSEVRDICSEATSAKDENNQYSPKIFYLDNNEIVLTESTLIADSPIGVWAVFNMEYGEYFLRAVIDLR